MKRYGKLVCIAIAALLAFAFLGGAAFAKELVVYSSVDEENAKNLLDEFSKATGITVNMVFLSSGPAMSRIGPSRPIRRRTSGSALPTRITSSQRTAA